MEQFLLTVISVFFVLTLIWTIRKGLKLKVKARAWIFAIAALLLIPFGLAWCVTSFGENEPTAGYMGIFVFSGLGIISVILAYKEFFPGAVSGKTEKGSSTPIGKLVLVCAIGLLVALTLPLSIVTRNMTRTLSDKEKAQQMVFDHLLSDQALPNVVKKGLAYETLYAGYPSHLKFRMIQSMVSGVENEQMVHLLDTILPEKERKRLLNELAGATEQWFTTDNAYPDYALEPMPYFEKIEGNPEMVVRWIYHNFSLPEMKRATLENVVAGNFSENFDDYMQSPPDSLKERMIVPAANALGKQLESAEVPAYINIGDEMKTGMDEAEVLGIKKKIRGASTLLKNLWILPVILIGLLVFILFRSIGKSKRLKWMGWSLLGIGVLGLLFSLPLQNVYATTSDIVLRLSEKAPPPALALIEALSYPLLDQAARPALTLLYAIVLLGGLLLILAYAKGFTTFFNAFNAKNVRYGQAKKTA